MKVYKIVNLLPNFLKKGPPLRGKFPLLLHPELHLAENPPLLPLPNARAGCWSPALGSTPRVLLLAS